MEPVGKPEALSLMLASIPLSGLPTAARLVTGS